MNMNILPQVSLVRWLNGLTDSLYEFHAKLRIRSLGQTIFLLITKEFTLRSEYFIDIAKSYADK